MDREIAELQSTLGEAQLILAGCRHILEAEPEDFGPWREMAVLLTELVAIRVESAARAVSRLELGQPGRYPPLGRAAPS